MNFNPTLFSTHWFSDSTTLNRLVLNALQPVGGASSIPPEAIAKLNEPRVKMIADVAIIPAHGPFALRVSAEEKFWLGLADYDDVRSDIGASLKAGAKDIFLDMASPGGSVLGVSELATYIRDIAQSGAARIISFNGHHSCSAAEYFTAGCSLRIASPSAINGSIGTISAVASFKEMFARAGVDVRIYTSGDLKATGHPLGEITDAQDAHMKDRVVRYGAEFRDWMRANRGQQIADEAMRGQTLSTSEALENGLIDGIAPTLSDLIKSIRPDI